MEAEYLKWNCVGQTALVLVDSFSFSTTTTSTSTRIQEIKLVWRFKASAPVLVQVLVGVC